MSKEKFIEMANEVFKEFEDKIESLKEDIEELEEQVKEAESISSFTIEGDHDNIRTVSCLESIFKNLDYIPIEELETIAKKYAVL